MPQDTARLRRYAGLPGERLIGALLDISNLVGSVMRLDDILDRIVAIASDVVGMPICSIYLLEDGDRLVLRSNIGLEPELVGRASFGPGEGLPGWVAAHGELVSLADANIDARFKPMVSVLEKDCHAYVAAPLRIQEELIGVLAARSNEVRALDREEALLFETISKMIAIVIEKARIYQQKSEAEELAAVAVSLSGIAHYIKNVMFTTKIAEAVVDRGLTEMNPETRVSNAWTNLKDSNRKIRKLVEDLLNYTRETASQFQPEDLNGIIREVVERVQENVSKDGILVVTNLDPSLKTVPLDKDAMYDVLLNLLTNAIDAIPGGHGGTVTVRTRRLPNQNNVRIDVVDDGKGIPKELRDKVFNLFFTTKGEGGSGIGLAATRKVIERHGGSIDFETRSGKGTCFRVFLPIRRVEVA